jgi:phage tail-like protein
MPEARSSIPRDVDPYRAYNFKLVIEGVTEGHFTKCKNLGIAVEAIQYREAGNNQVVRWIPGKTKNLKITLEFGLTASRQLWDWFMLAVAGTVERKNVSILMLESDGVTEAMRWDLINAWPSEWCGPSLDAMSDEIAIESMTLVCEELKRA